MSARYDQPWLPKDVIRFPWATFALIVAGCLAVLGLGLFVGGCTEQYLDRSRIRQDELRRIAVTELLRESLLSESLRVVPVLQGERRDVWSDFLEFWRQNNAADSAYAAGERK